MRKSNYTLAQLFGFNYLPIFYVSYQKELEKEKDIVLEIKKIKKDLMPVF